MMITVYTKNQCQQCNFTKSMMDREEIEYELINIDEDAEALAYAQTLGFMSAPIVVVDGEALFAGFQPDRIMSLKV